MADDNQPATMPSSVECSCWRAWQTVKKSERYKNVFVHGNDCRCAPTGEYFKENADKKQYRDVYLAIHAEHERPYRPKAQRKKSRRRK